MKPLALAAALSTLCLTSCGDDPTRGIVITPDAARLEDCPASFPPAPSLAPLSVITLSDGREVVLLDVVIDRETQTARYILRGRGAWFSCRTAVKYVQDWSAGVGKR